MSWRIGLWGLYHHAWFCLRYLLFLFFWYCLNPSPKSLWFFFFLPLTSFEVPILSNFVDFPFIVKSVLQTKEKFEKLLLCDVEGMDKDRLSVRRLGQFFLKWTKTVIDFQTWRLSLSKNKNKNKHTNKKGVQKAVGRWSWKKTHLEFSWEISKSNHE